MLKQRLFYCCLLIVMLVVCPTVLRANGGPVDGSIVQKTGDPHLMQVKDVELFGEKLEMTIEGDYTHVRVIYRLRNKTNNATGKIHYGFPVEYQYKDCCDQELTDDFVRSIVFKFNGKELPVTGSSTNPNADYNFLKVDEENESKEEDDWSRIWRKWFYTDFSIPANELVTLEVSYTVKNGFEDWGTSKSFFTYYSERQLVYNFSPAAAWGDGIVKDFQVIVKASDPIQISGLPFQENGNVYSYSKADFNLNTASPLSISYDVSVKNYVSEVISSRLGKEKMKSVKASFETADYPFNHLFDGDTSTAWVAGKSNSGVGEWIEIELSLNASIFAAIVLINGYTKSEKTYYTNNRIKKIGVELHHNEGDYVYNDVVELEDLPYQVIDINTFAPMSSVIFSSDGYPNVKKIRLTILDIYKGTTYDDTCLSELFILGYTPSDY